MMKNGLAILVAILLIGLLSTTAFAKPDRDLKIDKDTAALLTLGFGGGYNDSYSSRGYYDPWDRGRHRGYQQGNHYGWGNQWSRDWPQYSSYRYQPRTGFRIQIGDGYLGWWSSGYGSHFSYGSDRGYYRDYDSRQRYYRDCDRDHDRDHYRDRDWHYH